MQIVLPRLVIGLLLAWASCYLPVLPTIEGVPFQDDNQLDGANPVVWKLDHSYQLIEPNLPPRKASSHLTVEPRHLPKNRATEWRVSLPPQSAKLPSQSGNSSDTITDLSSANLEIVFPGSETLEIHWNRGSHGLPNDFEPRSDALSDGSIKTFESIGGRSSDGIMPYFHIEDGNGGLIFAIGWSGDWRCTFSKQPNQSGESNRVSITAGLKHESLRPTNSVPLQLPSILVMTYQGDRDAGQNQFRRLMLQHFTPTNQPLDRLMPIAASVHGMIGFNDTNESNLISTLDRIGSLSLPIDTYWVDAGWNQSGFPTGQGNPNHDLVRFPNGLLKIGELAEQKQLRFLLWFEPERVMRNTQLANEKPEWLLKPSKTPEEFRYFENDGFFLFNLANFEARSWMLEQISNQITEWKVGVYRQDANIAPGFFWHTDLAPEDAAMLEIEYINGLYAFLDDLRRKHPALIIDGCAAGGRRLDFEMMRRSVVLWRSDSCWGDSEYPRNVQAMTMGLSRWLPLHGLGAAASNTTALRSGIGSCGSFAINYTDPDAIESLRKHLELYLPIRHIFHGDFYPLTKWSLDSESTIAYQFHDPKTGLGVVQAFCNNQQIAAPVRLFLKGLVPERTYVLQDWDNNLSQQLTGNQLMNDGISVFPSGDNRAIVIEYRPTGP
ncbi:MAG: alpha-galactosidase [Pirellula sp.]|jgi:alpha-galactosidase|nr:alpha-galactosidase [Pirellula sp.]